jgi:hypothetical protein
LRYWCEYSGKDHYKALNDATNGKGLNVDATKFRPLLFIQNIQLLFDRPIIDWTGVMQKYFDMILRSVGARIPVQVSQFSISTSSKVSDINARYNVYGGASSITLFPDKLVFDFPQLLLPDIPLVRDLLRTIHDAFEAEFSQVSYARVDIQTAQHLELLPPTTVAEFLGRYRIKDFEEVFAEVEAVVEPAIRFSAKSSKPPWTCIMMAEQSLMNAAAIYYWESMSISDAAAVNTFDDKFKLVTQIGGLSLRAFKLEHVGAATE